MGNSKASRLKLSDLNPEEIFVGASFSYPAVYLIGWWVIPLMAVNGLLWAMGGAQGGDKLYRRLDVPILTAMVIFLENQALWPACLLWVVFGYGALTIGYGMPDKNDEGSLLGRFYLRTIREYLAADLATRLTSFVLYWASFIVCVKVCVDLGWVPNLLG